jgi:threonine dehydrogenase-like Zn-dependent dehydrogenase
VEGLKRRRVLLRSEKGGRVKAIALVPGTKTLRVVERPEPEVTAPDEIKVKVLRVGICGTDREEASGGRADAPPGKKELIIGHEMFGRVVQVGSSVRSVGTGDYAVFSVRRGCSRCPACAIHRSDMCYTGDYTERGIKGQDGYQTEYVVDREPYVVKIPEDVAPVGVLAEPTSVVEKAIDEAVAIQTARLPDVEDPSSWLKDKRALVAGIGTIGLLGIFALRLRGAEVMALGREDADTLRPSLLTRIGAKYIDERQVRPDRLEEHFGQIDLILEATGAARLEFDLLSALGINGLYVLTGIPGADRPINIEAAALMRKLVLKNQVMVGSVNESQKHFQMAVQDLKKARETWGNAIDQMITHQFPYQQFEEALALRSKDEIKTVLVWGK